MKTSAPKSDRTMTRRGALLLLVLITGTIISVISLGALIVQNVHLTQGTSMKDATAARWSARSGIALATQDVSGSTAWRNTKTPGTWYTGVKSNSGTMSVAASDPTDTSFADSITDPVLLEATGSVGNSVQKSSGLLLAESALRQATMFHLVCGDDLTVSDATVEGPGWIGVKDQISVGGVNSVRCDVLTGDTDSPSGFLHRVTTGATLEDLPTYSDFTDIVSLGTAVSGSQIPNASTTTAETILNPDFGRGNQGWMTAPDGDLDTFSSGGVGNSSCAEVDDRPSTSCGLVHDVTGIIRRGLQTQLSAAVMPLSSASTFELSLIVTTTTGTSTAASWTSGSISAGSFYTSLHTISTTVTPTWSGRLISAQLKIRTNGAGSAGTQDFRVDNVSMKISSAPSGKAIYRTVVSTGTNPFSVTSNSNGIYVLDCGGNDVTISDCMIVGTLVLRNTGTVRVGSGPIQWRPARPGLPALVVDGDLILSYSRFGLTERELNVNLNPGSTADENGSTDTSMNDTYMPELRGLIFASGDVTLAGDLRINGTVICGDDMTIQQRAILGFAPQYLTVPRQATHATKSFLRETTGVTRAFD